MRQLLALAALAALALAPAAAATPSPAPASTHAAAPHAGPKLITLPDGLQYLDQVVGKGAQPAAGRTVTVHYVGRLLTNGSIFDASRSHGGPFSFTIGVGQVIKGWDEGVATMHVGGKRRLIVPPELAYGDRGVGSIPPNASLVFDVELLDVK